MRQASYMVGRGHTSSHLAGGQAGGQINGQVGRHMGAVHAGEWDGGQVFMYDLSRGGAWTKWCTYTQRRCSDMPSHPLVKNKKFYFPGMVIWSVPENKKLLF